MINRITFLLICFFSGMVSSFAQSDLVILSSNDTIRDIDVLQVNEGSIQYKDFSRYKTVYAKDLQACWDDNKYYTSVNLGNGVFVIVHYDIIGYTSFGTSKYDKTLSFYIRQDSHVQRLKEDNLLGSLAHLERFKEFKRTYEADIVYDYQSLANMVSSYNHFLFPEKYIATKYANPFPFNVNIDFSAGIQFYKNRGTSSGVVSLIGFNLQREITERFLTETQFVGMFSNANITEGREITLRSLVIEPHFLYQISRIKDVKNYLGVGVGLQSNFKGELNSNPQNAKLQAFNGIYSIMYLADLKNAQFYLKFSKSHLSTSRSGQDVLLGIVEESFSITSFTCGLVFKLHSNY